MRSPSCEVATSQLVPYSATEFRPPALLRAAPCCSPLRCNHRFGTGRKRMSAEKAAADRLPQPAPKTITLPVAHATAANAMLPPSTVVSASEPTRVDRILDALKCPICLDLFDDPLFLSGCAHTFCRKCITKHLRGSKLPYYSKCPECKKPATKRDCLPYDDLASVVQAAKRARDLASVVQVVERARDA